MKLSDMNILTLKLRHFDAFKTVLTSRRRKVFRDSPFSANVKRYLNIMGNIYEEIIKVIKTSLDLDNSVKIDNFVFRLHRAYSVLLCIIFAVLLSLSQVSRTHMCSHDFYKMTFLNIQMNKINIYSNVF